jgi:hypothetical protein
MCKSFIKVGLFTIALAAGSAFAQGTVDSSPPDSQAAAGSQSSSSEIPRG